MTFYEFSLKYVDLVNGLGRRIAGGVKSFFRGIAKHKTVLGGALLVVVISYLAVADPLTANIANAADSPAYNPGRSPKEYAEDVAGLGLSGSCEYLSFCRWWSLSQLPSPIIGFTNVGVISSLFPLWFATIFFAIASLIMLLVGLAIMLQSWLDPAIMFVYQSDYMFARMVKNLTTFENGQGNGFVYIAMMVIVFLILWYLWTIMKKNRGQTYSVGKQAFASFAILIVMLVMGFQAQKNHSEFNMKDQSRISSLSKSKTSLLTPGQSTISNWAIFSPGWAITSGIAGMNQGSKVINEAVSSVGFLLNSATETPGALFSGKNSCESYSQAMREVFRKTEFAGTASKADTMIAYDKFMGTLYFDNWRLAAMGNSASSSNAWCRVAEVNANKAAGDQIMISRVAGLYKEAIGSGSLNILDSNSKAINYKGQTVNINNDSTENAFVDGDGNWINAGEDRVETGYYRAASVFGPGYPNLGVTETPGKVVTGKDSVTAETKMPFVWAICQSNTNDKLSLNGEWNGLQYSSEAKGTWDSSNLDACKKALAIAKSDLNDDGFWKDLGKDLLGFGNPKFPDFARGFGSQKDASKEFAYYENSGLMGGALLGMGATSQYTALESSPVVLDYYKSVNGLNGGLQPLMTSLVVLALLIMFGKNFGGIIFVGFIAGQVASLALIFGFIFFFAMIIPFQKIRKFCGGLFLTIISGLLISILIGVVLNLAFATTNLFASIFAPIMTNSDGTVGFITLIIRSIVIVIPLLAWAQLLKKFNLTSVEGMMAITGSTIAPLAKRMGVDTPNSGNAPWDKEFMGKFVKDANPFSKSDDVTVGTDKNNVGSDANSASSGSDSIFKAGSQMLKDKAKTAGSGAGMAAGKGAFGLGKDIKDNAIIPALDKTGLMKGISNSKLLNNGGVQAVASVHPAGRAAVMAIKGASMLGKIRDIRNSGKNGEGRLNDLGGLVKNTKENGMTSPFTRNANGDYFNKGKKVESAATLGILKRLPIPLDDNVKSASSVVSGAMSSYVPDVSGKSSTNNTLIHPEPSTVNVNDSSSKVFNGLDPQTINKSGEEKVFGLNPSKSNVPLTPEEVRASMNKYKAQATKGAILGENLTPMERTEAASSVVTGDLSESGKFFEDQSKTPRIGLSDGLGISGTPGVNAALLNQEENSKMKGYISEKLGIPVDHLDNSDIKRMMESISSDGQIKSPVAPNATSSIVLDDKNSVTPEATKSLDDIAKNFQRSSDFGSGISPDRAAELTSPISKTGEPKTSEEKFNDNLVLGLGAESMKTNRQDHRSLDLLVEELTKKGAPKEEIEAAKKITETIKESGVITAKQFGEVSDISQRSRVHLGEETNNGLHLSDPRMSQKINAMGVGERAEFMSILSQSANRSLGSSGYSQDAYVSAVRHAAYEGSLAGSSEHSLPANVEQDLSVVRELIRSNRDLSVGIEALTANDPSKHESVMRIVKSLQESQANGDKDSFITPSSMEVDTLRTLRMILDQTRRAADKDLDVEVKIERDRNTDI